MRVSLAVQVLSRSAAVSLKFHREVLKDPDFKNSEATEEFLLMMNNIFDLLNSRSCKGKGYNSPLRFSNQHHWRIYFEEVKEYLLGLTNLETGPHLVQNDSKRTGFLGIYCNIIAFTRIFDDLVAHGPLYYIMTYKMSQDQLEHYFGLVHARFGPNNNPTPLQFRSIYRRLLLGVTNTIVKDSNVLLQDNSELVAVIPSVRWN